MRISDWSSDVCSSDLARWDSMETITVGLCRVPADKTKGYALSCAGYSAALRLRSVVSRHSRNALHSVIQRHHVSGLGEEQPALDEGAGQQERSEEHTSELQSLMRISYAVFCLK